MNRPTVRSAQTTGVVGDVTRSLLAVLVAMYMIGAGPDT